MSITAFPHRQEKICLHSSIERKQFDFDEVSKHLVKESPDDFPDEVIETRDENEDFTQRNSSICTERKLRRIKRKLFLDAVKNYSTRATETDNLTSARARAGKD